MTGSPAHHAPRLAPRLLDAPDPAGFVAEITPVDFVTGDAGAGGGGAAEAGGGRAPASIAATAVLADAARHGAVVAGRSLMVAGRGTAAVLELPAGLADGGSLAAVTAWLRAVEWRGTVGYRGTQEVELQAPAPASAPAPRPTALGAFPFDPSAPAVLTVPASTWYLDAEGRGWRIDVRRRGTGGGVPPHVRPTDSERIGSAGAPPSETGTGPVELVRTEVPLGAAFARAVARAVADIEAGRLRKVVLSRAVDLVLPHPADPAALLDRLWGGDPAFRPYSVPTEHGRLVGASPELLVARHGGDVASHAFAGTIALDGEGGHAVERLLASDKDRDEHRLVVEAIAEALGPRCSMLLVPDAPQAIRLRSDARLATLLTGTLRHDDSALELLRLLHPTPAVGGVPRRTALRRIADLEHEPRGPWAGAVGWVDAEGDGDWVLAIRSAHLRGRHANVRAGAGIVAGSDPQRELEETTIKLSPVLEALLPGASRLG